MKTIIACTNRSSIVVEQDFRNWIMAQQLQLDNEFSQEWDVSVELIDTKDTAVPANAWSFDLLDTSDQPGAAGYHNEVGQPMAKAFALTDKQHGLNWTVTASHEILETLADPDINLTVLVRKDTGLALIAEEVCDACEADQLGKVYAGVLLSDFVTRKWFMPGSTGLMDANNHLRAPLTIAPGGYFSELDLAIPHQGWKQVGQSRHPESSPRREYRKWIQ